MLGFFKYSGISIGLEGVAVITVTMEIDTYDTLIVYADAMIPGDEEPEPVALAPSVSVSLPNVNESHAWFLESLISAYGATLDLATLSHD